MVSTTNVRKVDFILLHNAFNKSASLGGAGDTRFASSALLRDSASKSSSALPQERTEVPPIPPPHNPPDSFAVD